MILHLKNAYDFFRDHMTPEQHDNGDDGYLNVQANGAANFEEAGNSGNTSAIKGSERSKVNRGHNYSKSGKNFLAMNKQVRPSK